MWDSHIKVPALFTFGLSIPVGASIGLMAGATTGGSAGAVGGGAIGFAGFTYREEIKRQGNHPPETHGRFFGGFFWLCVKIGTPTRACWASWIWRSTLGSFGNLFGSWLDNDWIWFFHSERSADYLRRKSMDSAEQAGGVKNSHSWFWKKCCPWSFIDLQASLFKEPSISSVFFQVSKIFQTLSVTMAPLLPSYWYV